MFPVQKALWFIESHFNDDLTLDDVAECGGVSRFYMSRVFVLVTGRSVSAYVRGRRLTEAARALADGAPDILQVALNAGYGSHEAFTRAFRDLFGMTPEQIRAEGGLDRIKLLEPLRMEQNHLAKLEQPRFETLKEMLVAGLSERCHMESGATIPALWQRFNQYYGHVPGQVGDVAYGVCHNSDDAGHFDYMAGVEVRDFSDPPPDFARVRIPARKYAVFAHRGHVSTIRQTMTAIWTKWLPESGHDVADAPMFERYDSKFDPHTGEGGFEIWLPIKS